MNHSLIPTRAIVQVQGAKHWDRDGWPAFLCSSSEKSNTQVSNNIVLEISNVEGTIDTTSNVLIACMKFVFTQS